MKYYIIAGEASGDLHASNLIKALRKKDPQAQVRAWGGDLMRAQGAEIVKHYRELAFMGFVEVLMNLRTILRNLKFAKRDIEQFRPDAVILVDYPGFNLKVAEFTHSRGIKTFYYISPQVWAWKEHRVKSIKKHIDRMFVILPFEKDFYHRHHFEADFVGHPLLDALKNRTKCSQEAFREENGLDGRPLIALLPGSRKQEIAKMLPTMARMQDEFPDYQFAIAGAPSQEKTYYDKILGDRSLPVIFGRTYDLLSCSHAALVTSGTATLETALLEIPEVVCYKGSYISYCIARWVIRVPFISLVNLIMGRQIVKELIQGDFNFNSLREELGKILEGSGRDKILSDYALLESRLGEGSASETTAELILEDLSRTPKEY